MPAKEKIPIEGLVESYEAALTRTGYSITTKLLLVKRAELMTRRHLNAGLVYFDQAIINHYTSEIDDKYFNLPLIERGLMRIWPENIPEKFACMISGTVSLQLA